VTASWGGAVVRWLERLLLVELAALTFLLGCFLNRDTDIWWHLRAGREILGGGGIPRVDSYIFATTGAEWIDLHWGFQVAAAWIYSQAGLAGLTLGAGVMAAVAVSIGLAATKRQRSAVVIVWCWLPALIVMSARFFPRPEMLSLVCLAAVLYLLHRAAERPWLLWWLVPIQLFWVNVHALFVLGLVLLGCWLLDRVLHGRLSAQRHDWRHLIGAPIAVGLVCLANPYTWKGLLFPLTLFSRMSAERPFYGRHIGELMSIPDLVFQTGISSVYTRASLLLLVATAASFALRRARFPLFTFRLLAFVLFAGLGMLAVRNQPQFALVAGAVLAWNVGEWWGGRPALPLLDRAVAAMLTSAVLVGLMLWIATGGFYRYAAEGRVAGLGAQPFWYAHEAAAFAAGKDMPRHFVAYHEGQAAVLEFHMGADQRVFVDPRLEVSPKAALEQYYAIAASMAGHQPGWNEQLASLPQPVGLLVDHASHHAVEAALIAHDGWRCIWFDAIAGVYVPSSETDLVERHGVDFAERYFGRVDMASDRLDTRHAMVGRLASAESLFRVGRDLLAAHREAQPQGRLMMLLGAASLGDLTAIGRPSSAASALIARTSLNVYGHPDAETPVADWPAEAVLGIARARHFLMRALERSPADFQAWLTLFGIAQVLGDSDALWVTGHRLAALQPTTAAEFEVQRQVRVVLRQLLAIRAAEPLRLQPSGVPDRLARAGDLVEQRRFLRALDTLDESFEADAGGVPPPWEFTDLRATLMLWGGDPARARVLWSQADESSVAPSVLARRLAHTYFVEGRLAEAADAYRRALTSDPDQAGTRYGLALTYLELRDAAGFVRECHLASSASGLTQDMVEFCRGMSALAAHWAGEAPRSSGTVQGTSRP
jgi:tetratricopeptide (TPR) repeat protein